MNQAAGIHYGEAGPAAAGASDVPIICLHGIGGDIESFRPQLDGLSDDFRVLSWNMPGYGQSVALEETTFETLSQALAAFMDALSIRKAHIVGQSIGGMVAQDFALRFPDRAASLVLIGTTPAFGGRDESFKEAFLAARLGPLDAGQSMLELATSSAPEIVGPIASEEVITSVAKSMAGVPDATYRAILKCLVTFNRRDDQENIHQPVCLIAGSHDKNAPARTMEKMAGKLPDARYHLIEGAGHMINLEAADESNEIIRTFIKSLEAQS